MAIREVDAISDAIIETEREIAGGAWGEEDTERDASGDHSLEDLGEGLEGQHEADDDDGVEDDEVEAADAEAEAAEAAAAAAAKPGAAEPPKPVVAEIPEGGRVPSRLLRESNEAKRAAEAERDALKAQIEKGGETKVLADKLDLALREIENLKRAPVAPKAAAEPVAEVIPDIFEDPKGFAEHLTKGFQTELGKRDAQLANQRVETSMAIAHAVHKDDFAKAFEAVNKLNPGNPDDRVVVQRIYASPNPGEALVAWHKRQQTFAEVGDNPAAYRERIAKETREALMADPEFKRQLIAEMRGEALQPGPDGRPRTVTRLPRSLHNAGSNAGAERVNSNAHDDSDQAVAESAWR